MENTRIYEGEAKKLFAPPSLKEQKNFKKYSGTDSIEQRKN